MSESVNFSKQLKFVEQAGSKIFNTHIGKCINQILNEGEYEDVNEILNDLNNINDSMILHSVSDTIKSNQNVSYKWNKQNDKHKLHTILIKIFKHNIIDMTQLTNNTNTLIDCDTEYILKIAKNVIESINKTAKKQINIEMVQNMITNEQLNGKQISNITNIEFCKKCKPYKIAMGKATKILNAIKQYEFEPNLMQKTIEQIENKSEPIETETKINKECKDENGEIHWNNITQIIDCDNKHILYIMNKYVFNDVTNATKSDKVKEKLDFHKDKMIEFVKENNLNGKQIKEMKRKEFGSKIAKHCNNTTLLAVGMKVQKFINEFDVKRVCVEDEIKSNPKEDIKDNNRKDKPVINQSYNVSEFKQCTTKELVYLLENHIIDTLNHKKLNECKDKIVSYFRDNKIDGKSAMNMARKEFINNLTTYCGNAKLKGAIVQLYKIFKNGTIDISTVQLPISLKPNESKQEEHKAPSELKLEDVGTGHIIYVLHNHIFNEINNDKLNENKSEIIKYIRLNHINGQKIIKLGRKDFSKNIATYCKDLSLNAALTKVYRQIKDYKYNTIPNKVPINSLPLPCNIEECSVNELLFIINDEIVPKIPKLVPLKNKINTYIKKHNINGANFRKLKRKQFTNEVIAEIGVKNIRPAILNLYNKLDKFEFGQELRRNVSASSAASEIALSITTAPLETDISLVYHTPKRVKSTCSNFSTESASSYENLRCDVIALMAKDHATKSLSMTHKKIQRSIDKNGVDGKQFMNKFDVNDGDAFVEFFNHKVCGGKPKKGTNKKFAKFRKWLINEINENNVELKDYNILEMTKFILDGYDEFIAHLFVVENINGHAFVTDYRTIVAKICDKYGVPRGGITNLCHAIEDKLKNDVAKYSRNNVAKSKRWCSKKSTRFLPKIDYNEKLEDDDDDSKQSEGSLVKLNMNEFIDMVGNVINDINISNSYSIESGKLIKLFQTRQMNGRMFNFYTEQSFGSLLNTIGIKQQYSQLIYRKIKSYKNNLNNKIEVLYEKKEPIEWSDSVVDGSDIIILSDIIDEINKDNNIKQKINKQILVQCVTNNVTVNKLKDLSKDKWIHIIKECNILESISVLMLNRLKILSFKWNRKITKLDECSMDELLYVLCKYILPKIDMSMENKEYIVKYMKMKDINGSKLNQLGVASFRNDLKNQYKIPRGPASKVFNQLSQFKYDEIREIVGFI